MEPARQRSAPAAALDPAQAADILDRYDQWLKLALWIFPERPKAAGQPGRAKQHPATNLLRRMRDFKDEVFRFLHDFQVPFDNNLVERLVRPVKVKLKVSCGFRALGGSAAFCVLRSVWETNKRQGVNSFHTLRIAFAGGLVVTIVLYS